jgi:acyl-CoA thioesterase II
MDVDPALGELLDLLDLETIEVDLYRGRSPKTSMQRVFGGQVAGQALVAAGRTAPDDRSVHSLHAYFLRPGDPTVPILYEVDRIREGRSFTTRRVAARQHGQAIFHMSASFQVAEDGFEHQATMPEAPGPENLKTLAEMMAAAGRDRETVRTELRAIDVRYVLPEREAPPPGNVPGRQQIWFRAVGQLPDDPLLHVCVLAYASDLTLLGATLGPHGILPGSDRVQMASLDHAMWFHRPFRVDEWLLYDEESPSASGARGLATGRIFSRDGRLVASVVQEGLIRPFRPPDEREAGPA